MTAAYYSACLQLSGTAALSLHTGELKTKLVRVILAAACTGERSKNRLEQVAFKALSPTRCKTGAAPITRKLLVSG